MPTIEGPFSFKAADGLKTPAYVFLPGGEKKDIGEVTVKVDGGMTFDVQLDEDRKDMAMAHFVVPMRYTYLNRPDTPMSPVYWSQNCLTFGDYHGRSEPIWNLTLFQAVKMFQADELKTMVLARIYNDAMMYVNHSPFVQKGTGKTMSMSQEWADKVKELAETYYLNNLKVTIGKASRHYKSENWELEQHNIVELIKADNLNPGYTPVHEDDSINMFCHILGTKCAKTMKNLTPTEGE